jgi:hypothetical protein
MKKWQLTALMVTLLAIQVFAGCNLFKTASAQTSPKVYVGVDIAYGAVSEAKSEIDRVSTYTNLVVLGSTQITWFPDRVQETFQYAYDKGLSIISLLPSITGGPSSMNMSQTEWYPWAKSTWGDRLLGFYYLDEPGGRTLDGNFSFAWNQYTGYPSTYTDAASKFTAGVSDFINSQKPKDSSFKAFTSDYALYWYDYKAGYDTVFAEFGWNYSLQINVALCRGAAAAENKDWGAIITWTYNSSPYIESGDQLYNDMVLAYDNGAKYIVVFDSNEKGGSILQQEHFDAMQRFWNYAQNNQPKTTPKNERTAYVLPNDYGFGFRWPTDHIWGIWEADALTPNITKSVGTLLNQYNEKLDIIYDDGLQPGKNGYNQLIYWNAYAPTPTPSPSPTLSPTPTISPTPTPPPPATFPTALAIVVTMASVAIVSVFIILRFKKKHN